MRPPSFEENGMFEGRWRIGVNCRCVPGQWNSTGKRAILDLLNVVLEVDGASLAASCQSGRLRHNAGAVVSPALHVLRETPSAA